MFRRIISNPVVQQFGKKVATDIAQSAAEDAISNATGVQPGRTGAPTLGEALYTLGKGAMQHHQQVAEIQTQQAQMQQQRMLRQQKLIADAQENAMKRLRQERGLSPWLNGKLK